MKECQVFINIRRETRHSRPWRNISRKLTDCAIKKISIGKGGCSNMHGDHTSTAMNTACVSPVHNNTTNKWVINISSKP